MEVSFLLRLFSCGHSLGQCFEERADGYLGAGVHMFKVYLHPNMRLFLW